MIYISRCSAILFLLILAPLFLVAEETRTVTVGAFNNYPVNFQDTDGNFKGLYVDLLDEIGKKENISFTYVYGTWNEGLDRIKSGEVDMLTSVAYTPERSKFMDYCENPVLTVWGELYVPRNSEIKGILEVADKKIGVMKGDINARNFKELTTAFNIMCHYIEYSDYQEVFHAVKSKLVDAGVAGITYGAANQTKFNLKPTGIVFNPLNLYFTVSKKADKELLSLLDEYVFAWKNDDDSVFTAASLKWLHNSVHQNGQIPDWLEQLLFLLVLILLLSFVFIILLRLQVSKATGKIRETEEIFNQFLIHSPIYVFFKDENIRVKKLSSNYRDLLGKPVGELIGKDMTDLFPIELAQKMIEDDKKIILDGKPVTIDEELNGRKFTTTKFSFQTAKNVSWLAGFTIDVTESRLAEERINSLLAEKDLLLREVHHRIKNNMTTIKGLLSLQIASETNPSAAESLRDAESRVQSIILLYDKLYCTDNYRELPIRDYLQPLAEEIIHSFAKTVSVTSNISIDNFILNMRLLSPLGIIVNELLTNCMKHAFVGRDNGHLTISASLTGTRVKVVIQDNGVGIPDTVNFEQSEGFGMQIAGMLSDQIGATIYIERIEGTRFIIEFDI